MKSFLISDNRDTLVGLKLAGINGIIVHNREDALKEMKEAIQNSNIGILILTEKVVDILGDEVLDYKVKSQTPLIIEIPGRYGTTRKFSVIEEYIRNSVGIRIWGYYGYNRRKIITFQ